jgi:hypothetical protein
MKLSEFRKLIREEVKRVLKEGVHEGPLSGLVKGFDDMSNRLDYEMKVKQAWTAIPKETMQASYEKLDQKAQKEFVDLITAATQNPTIKSILQLCRFILVQKNFFDPKVVQGAASISQIQQ